MQLLSDGTPLHPLVLLQAGHIIGMKHRQYASALQIDVMSGRNGILWLSVLEDAWTRRQFCFTSPPGGEVD
jgi:hypothetical protein